MPYGKVLVVDDVSANLYIAEGLLNFYQLDIETAESGYEAIEKVQSGKIYDIIFMDHMMPMMDGMEATAILRNDGYGGTIVALTANALVGNEEIFLRNGFDGFLSKPIDVRQLNNILDEFVRAKYPQYSDIPPVESEVRALPPDARIMKAVLRDAEKAIGILRDAVLRGDTKTIATAVHGVKVGLANIGENTTANLAIMIEKAALSNQAEFVYENVTAFISALETLTSSGGKPANLNTEPIVEDIELLTEQLHIIRNACDDCDFSTAYDALDLLDEYKWKPETIARLEKIRTLLYSDSDFDGVMALIR
jgi:CheY-like chemotaxis protein